MIELAVLAGILIGSAAVALAQGRRPEPKPVRVLADDRPPRRRGRSQDESRALRAPGQEDW